MTRVESRYLTSTALTKLRPCLLRSASSYIASKVSTIASPTLGVIPKQLFRLGKILCTRKPKWSTSLSAIEKITAVQTCQVVAMQVCSWRTSAEHARVSCCRYDERMCTNKPLFWVHESSQANDVSPPTVLQTLVSSVIAIRSQLG